MEESGEGLKSLLRGHDPGKPSAGREAVMGGRAQIVCTSSVTAIARGLLLCSVGGTGLCWWEGGTGLGW